MGRSQHEAFVDCARKHPRCLLSGAKSPGRMAVLLEHVANHPKRRGNSLDFVAIDQPIAAVEQRTGSRHVVAQRRTDVEIILWGHDGL